MLPNESVEYLAQLVYAQHCPRNFNTIAEMQWDGCPRTVEYYEDCITLEEVKAAHRHPSTWIVWYFALDEFVYNANTVQCLLSPHTYIRSCKEWFLRNPEFRWKCGSVLSSSSFQDHPVRCAAILLPKDS